MTGLLFVDKPAGLTSHDVVGRVRRAARTRRVGHAGTLDPFATGLLVVAVGACTRLLPYIDAEPKVYDAEFRFGAETTTDDPTGELVREAVAPSFDARDPALDDALARAIAALTGEIMQTPPAYSAKHVDGQRAYAVARRGGDVRLAPVPVTVHSWQVTARGPGSLQVRITCAGGTYIRALARDLGRALGTAAHCATLRRVASGAAHVGRAVALETLSPGSVADGVVPLQSPLALLGHLTRVECDDAALVDLSHGRAIPASDPGSRAVLVHGGAVIGIADRVSTVRSAENRGAGQILERGHHEGSDRWQPRVVLVGGAA